MSQMKFRRKQPIYRFYVPILSRIFPSLSIQIPRFISAPDMFRLMTSSAMYILGPFLVVVTLGLIYALAYTMWFIIIPLELGDYFSARAVLHQSFVMYVILNILYNYYRCVTTRNFSCESYDIVVKELARATGFDYPEDEHSMEEYRNKYRRIIMERVRQRRLQERAHVMRRYGLDEENPSNVTGTLIPRSGPHQQTDTIENIPTLSSTIPPSIECNETEDSFRRKVQQDGFEPSWVFLGPQDWSYDERVRLPKPPRSHFDHVTGGLVLNMDHYCPWMFNVIGYFNYRYFCNFLLYVFIGMTYGASMTIELYRKIDSEDYFSQIKQSRQLFRESAANEVKNFRYEHVQHLIPGTPVPNETSAICFSFMICTAIGLSVTILLGFHIYLILTAQTTIEYHGNRLKKARCNELDQEFKNPYDLGFKRNLEQVWGEWKGGWFIFFIMAFLPRSREPDFLPIPLKGDAGKRSHWTNAGNDEKMTIIDREGLV
jgi:palmitoyltransferase